MRDDTVVALATERWSSPGYIYLLSEQETTAENGGVEEGAVVDNPPTTYYCPACVEQIGLAIEACCDQFDDRCIVYDNVASAEEEQASMICNILSMHAYSNGLGIIDVHEEDEEDEVHR